MNRYIKAFVIPSAIFIIASWWILGLAFFDIQGKQNEMILAGVYLTIVFIGTPLISWTIWKKTVPKKENSQKKPAV